MASNNKNIIESVLKGVLDISVLNKAVEYILSVVFKVTQTKKENATYDNEKHNDLAREAAENSIVLLKNKHNIKNLISTSPKPKICPLFRYANSS